MSHFYNRKSYTFSETDEMMIDIRKEMSNFITKEEAEFIYNRRYAIVDPPPFYNNHEISKILDELKYLKNEVKELRRKIYEDSFDEPTL